ncbi:hypothetical protein GMI69_09635 [Eggerthellaceae bacterium zg-887]|uniref:anaerobic ribonucleoside-triphosphate reductase n=1 Tax=Xiamenia xianingshaonis TaxID=2682776 RepID=UPI0014091E5B|nr:anaerobic ribonucleoside-triphosphate reductase [Xiamenia xianingshaonis]NHM16903.1 hypothetical protein [Xiamenia xianingshaonis]
MATDTVLEPVASVVDGVAVTVNYRAENGIPVSDQEIRAYIDRGNCHHPGCTVRGLDLTVDGDDIDIRYDLSPMPFERIRRITGYLVGTMDRWNDAKTAEEADRVKHSVPANCGCFEGK